AILWSTLALRRNDTSRPLGTISNCTTATSYGWSLPAAAAGAIRPSATRWQCCKMSKTALFQCTVPVRTTAWLSSPTPGRSTGGRRRSAGLPCRRLHRCLIGGHFTRRWRETGVGHKASGERRKSTEQRLAADCLQPPRRYGDHGVLQEV